MATVRFYRGELLLGVTEVDPEIPLIELAESIGVDDSSEIVLQELWYLYVPVEIR